MPKRKTKKKLTLVEILILAAIAGIFLSIVIPAAKKSATTKQLRDKAVVVPSYGETRGGGGDAGGALFWLGVGFGLGVGATLLYQRWRKKQSAFARAPQDSEEEKPRVVH